MMIAVAADKADEPDEEGRESCILTKILLLLSVPFLLVLSRLMSTHVKAIFLYFHNSCFDGSGGGIAWWRHSWDHCCYQCSL